MADVFISYAREDEALAKRLCKSLGVEGNSVWMDERLNLGEEWRETLYREVRASLCLVGLWTSHSVDTRGFFRGSGKTSWVELEHEWAGADRIVGVTANGGVAPGVYKTLQTGCLDGWVAGQWHPDFQRLLARIKSLKSVDALQKRNETLEAKLRIAEERLSAHSAERASITIEMHNRVADEAAKRAELEVAFQNLERGYTELLLKVAVWKEQSEKAASIVDKLQTRIAELEFEKQKLTSDVLHFKNEADEYARKSRELQVDLDASREEYAEFRRRRDLKPSN